MKRLGRWALNVVTAVSLLVCVATLGLWVRSYWAAETCAFGYHRAGVIEDLSAGVSKGNVGIEWVQPIPRYASLGFSGGTYPPVDFYSAWEPQDRRVRFFGLWLWESHSKYGYARSALVPCWTLVLLSTAMPMTYLRRLRKLRQMALVGNCARCHYDLTGNVSGVCPECGRATIARSIGEVPRHAGATSGEERLRHPGDL